MATLEDAAEALVVKLRGLDSEMEESEDKLEDLRSANNDDWRNTRDDIKESIDDLDRRLDEALN